jgi:hypothetical protein
VKRFNADTPLVGLSIGPFKLVIYRELTLAVPHVT